MSTTESTPSENQRFSRIFGGTTSTMIVVIAICALVGGLLTCGGVLALPVLIQRQKLANEAETRAKTVEKLKQFGLAIRKEAEADAAKPLEASQAGDDALQPVEPE